MKRVGFYILAAVVAFVFFTYGGGVEKSVTEWLERRKVLEYQVEVLGQQVTSLHQENDRLKVEIAHSVIRIAPRKVVIDTLIREFERTPVPDTCQALVWKAHEVIDSQAAQIVDLAQAFEAQQQVSANLQSELDATNATLDSATTLVRSAPLKRSLWSKLKPKFVVTVGPSYDLVGKTATPAAITVGAGWSW